MNSSHQSRKPKYVHLLQEFSIPLLLGVVVALIIANVMPQEYDKMVHGTYAYFTGEAYVSHAGDHGQQKAATGHGQHGADEHHQQQEGHVTEAGHHAEEAHGHETEAEHHDKSKSSVHASDEHEAPWKHYATMHFIINDLFMVIFFGIAAKEITESCLPGGALNPPSKAVNPLLGTIGGVVGPVGVYLLLNQAIGESAWQNGWGIPTATDIALAWLIARLVFGAGHPAVSFLLLLAVADDGIGLGIIAFAYPDPAHPTEWANAIWIVPGMAVAYGLRVMKIQSWLPYIFVGGALSWWGFYSAHLHPALALVPIVPFLPGSDRDVGIFRDEAGHQEQDPLNRFEHDVKAFVDFGLFFFAFANAGVQFGALNNLTWIVLLSLLIGKTVGITLFSWVGCVVGFPLPDGMRLKHLFVAGIVAGLGLTVALFVAGQAFKIEHDFQAAAKMGALFSAAIAVIAIVLGRILNVKELCDIDPVKE